MPFDSLTLAAAEYELKTKILGSRVIKIHQPDKFSIILRLHNNGQNYRLLLSAHPVLGRIHLTENAADNPTTPPLFCMVLRKHLEGAKITAIAQQNWDRVIHIDFNATDETGEPVKRRLILEIMGKHSNLVLTDSETGLIFDGIRRYSYNLSRHREILPGRTYIAPPAPHDKVAFEHITAENLQIILLEKASDNLSISIQRLISKAIAGLSPFLVKEIIYRSGLTTETAVEFMGEYEYTALWRSFAQIKQIRNIGSFEPVLLKANNTYYDYAAIKLIQVPEAEQEPCPTISTALDAYYSITQTNNLFKARQNNLLKLINNEHQRLAKKIALQESDLAETVAAKKYKEAGELLTTYMYLLEKGMQNITLNSFYKEEEEIKIKLLPELSPMDNIKRYFAKYNKAKKSQTSITEQLNKNKEELEYVESVLLNLENAQTLDDIEQLKQELTEAGYLKPKPLKKGQKTAKIKDTALLEPLKYQSTDGHTILAGKNNKQNDFLTLKKAQKQDIWLHTQKIPGSHVIICHEFERPITPQTLIEAASIAAWHSKARFSAQVPVDYTTVSQVKKPNGAKPGMVIYFQQKTLYVQPKLPEI
ncbi:MAG: NFACT RNA binding domain-containing protein [Clostridia bacterium]|jgi:predicted ribosome quality control (RQC) complex YloA/Tae2 family protein|nr:NFACT RNA binding domain-containing protein [Clostridia bacterium]